MTTLTDRPLDRRKFKDPKVTAEGAERAHVGLKQLDTLWFNTGTLCNLACTHCYIESSPRNDSLVYISEVEVRAYLDEIEALGLNTREIGLTGGEPFMNPDIIGILKLCLQRGYHVLLLTNAMRPMMKRAEELKTLRSLAQDKLVLRVSLDHYGQEIHEAERGPRSWAPAIDGLRWLARQGFAIDVAGRDLSGEGEASLRAGYARLFRDLELSLDADDPAQLVIFPEMDETASVPEITTECWSILNVAPDSVMCASSRMVVKRRGEARPKVMPCTLLPHGQGFEMGESLGDALGEVSLNHPHCARFCVLGGASCSAR